MPKTLLHQRKVLALAVLQGRLSLKEAAAEFKLSQQRTAHWVKRFLLEGEAGLSTRSRG